VIQTPRPWIDSTVDHAARAIANDLDWNLSLLTLPAEGAHHGGDWCDAFAISDDAVALMIGDVLGHGEGAAEKTDLVRAVVASAMQNSTDPSEALSLANTTAYQWGDGDIVTAIVAILNRARRTFTFSNAGHPAPFIMTAAAHGFLGHAVGDLPLGIDPKHRAAKHVVPLPAEVMIVLYTDGVIEHNRDSLSGKCELVEACRAVYDHPVRHAARAIARRVFQNVRGHDDAAVAVLRDLPRLGSQRAERSALSCRKRP
jgi:serine phosphatase RsbU (regulator of sigma subunit)